MLGDPVLHSDASGRRANKRNHWIHSTSSKDATYYIVHRKRGIIVIMVAGILPTYTGMSGNSVVSSNMPTNPGQSKSSNLRRDTRRWSKRDFHVWGYLQQVC